MDLPEPVYVGPLGYALGERRSDVHTAALTGRLRSDPDDLLDAGFKWHHRAAPGTTPYQLGAAAVAQLGEVAADAIVYACCLPANAGGSTQPDARGDIKPMLDFPAARLQADLGLDGAIVVGIDQQACTGMLGSIRMAAALLATEPDWRQVLCVTADRFPAGAVYEQAYNLISDGAAACLVGRQPSRLRLRTVHQISNGGLGRAGDDETVGLYFGYTHRLVRETLARIGLTPADLDWVVTQNTHRSAWQILSRLLEIDAEKVWAPSLPDVGHVISADVIVNLSELLESGRLHTGDVVALVMAGYGLTWQCAVLEVVA